MGTIRYYAMVQAIFNDEDALHREWSDALMIHTPTLTDIVGVTKKSIPDQALFFMAEGALNDEPPVWWGEGDMKAPQGASLCVHVEITTSWFIHETVRHTGEFARLVMNGSLGDECRQAIAAAVRRAQEAHNAVCEATFDLIIRQCWTEAQAA